MFESTGSESYALVIESGDVTSGEFFVRTASSAAVIVSGSIEDGSGYLEFPDASLPAGDYWLVVRGLDGDTGSFSGTLFTITDVSDSLSADGNEHTLATNTPGQKVRFDFTVGSDKSLKAAVTFSAAGAGGAVTLYDDSDHAVAWAWMENSAAMLFSNPLPAGDYHLVVDPDGPAVGTVGVTPAAISDQIAGGTIGTPATAAISTSGQNYRASVLGNREHSHRSRHRFVDIYNSDRLARGAFGRCTLLHLPGRGDWPCRRRHASFECDLRGVGLAGGWHGLGVDHRGQ